MHSILFQAESKFITALWAIGMIAFIIMCGYSLYLTIDDYLTYPFVSKEIEIPITFVNQDNSGD